MSKSAKIFCTSAIMVIFLLKISDVIEGIKHALNICAVSIIPSLLVFMVFSDILSSLISECINSKVPIKLIVFSLGAVCGFPVGAAICDNLYQNKVLSEKDTVKLIPFCNNAAPGFVIGAIGASFYNDRKIGILIFVAQLLSAAIPLMFIKIEKLQIKYAVSEKSLLDIFCASLEKATFGVLKVCCTVCFFSAATQFFKGINLGASAILLEISNGSIYAADMFSTNPYLSIFLCGFCCGFSGISVIIQILSVLKNIHVSFFSILIKKIFQGVFCSVFSIIGYYLFF